MLREDFYRRNLPHWQPFGAEYFVTIRLDNTLPKAVVKQLANEQKIINDPELNAFDLTQQEKIKRRKIFKKYEALLDSTYYGPTWLAKPKVAEVVKEALLYRDKNEVDLYAFCIMANHMHIILKLLEDYETENEFPLTQILGRFKSYTGFKANQKLNRSGSFWHEESYDHVIRDNNELENSIKYVLNNPVKAGLIGNWQDLLQTKVIKKFIINGWMKDEARNVTRAACPRSEI